MTITKEKAIIIASERIYRSDLDLVLILDETIEKLYGWVLFYTSEKWLITGDMAYAIAGNAPFLVEKKTGDVVTFGTAHSTEFYIEEYEKSLHL